LIWRTDLRLTGVGGSRSGGGDHTSGSLTLNFTFDSLIVIFRVRFLSQYFVWNKCRYYVLEIIFFRFFDIYFLFCIDIKFDDMLHTQLMYYRITLNSLTNSCFHLLP
jgi:hypothetical protein